VHIPKTCEYRGALTYATLLSRVYPRRTWNAFEGKRFKPGALIDEAELWPGPEFPAIPVLLEYAGDDRTGRSGRRPNHTYLLWRYDRKNALWVELARCTGQDGGDWIEYIKPIARLELARDAEPIDARHAAAVSVLVLAALDLELEKLSTEDRHLVMSFVYREFTARATHYA
jgi:hypothetical protein